MDTVVTKTRQVSMLSSRRSKISFQLMLFVLQLLVVVPFCYGDHHHKKSLPSSIGRTKSARGNPTDSTTTTASQFARTFGVSTITRIHRGGSSSSSNNEKNDHEYDRYINIFIALERLRQIRDSSGVSYSIEAATTKARQYIEYSTKIIDAMGMTLDQYNTIGTTIQNNATLKEQVNVFFRLSIIETTNGLWLLSKISFISDSIAKH
jgi:hypothetical protein